MAGQQSEWPEGHRLAAVMNFRWPQMVPTPLKQVIPSAGSEGIQLMRDMMLWDPEKRPSAQQVRLVLPLVFCRGEAGNLSLHCTAAFVIACCC